MKNWGGAYCLLDNELKGCNCSRSGLNVRLNVRKHLLHKNFSLNLSSIRSGSISLKLRQIGPLVLIKEMATLKASASEMQARIKSYTMPLIQSKLNVK